MSRFHGTVEGLARTAASRRGSEKSGLMVTCNGWNAGVEVFATTDENGNDIFHIYSSGGSKETSSFKIGTVDSEGRFKDYGSN